MPRKSGHHAEGIGAFKCHASGRYYLAHVDDNGFHEDGAPWLSCPRSWWEACSRVDAMAEEAAKEHRRARAWARRLAAEMAARHALVDKHELPVIRNMRALLAKGCA